MEDKHLIDNLKRLKEKRGYTLHQLSKQLDIHISTMERWFRTNRINKIYADFVRKKLNLK